MDPHFFASLGIVVLFAVVLLMPLFTRTDKFHALPLKLKWSYIILIVALALATVCVGRYSSSIEHQRHPFQSTVAKEMGLRTLPSQDSSDEDSPNYFWKDSQGKIYTQCHSKDTELDPHHYKHSITRVAMGKEQVITKTS